MVKRRCRWCADLLTKKPGPGRWPTHCGPECRRQAKPTEPNTGRCICCGDPLAGQQTKYCTKACQSLGWQREHRELIRERQRCRWVPAAPSKWCENCGEPIPNSPRNQYCTRPDCRRVKNRLRMREYQRIHADRLNAYRRTRYNPEQVREQYWGGHEPCAACGIDTGKSPHPGRQRVCSDECRGYLTYGWPKSDVQWLTCLVCQRAVTAKSAHSRYFDTCSEPCTIEARAAFAPKPAEVRTAECERCGENFTTNQPAQRWCTKRCARKAAKIKRRVLEAGSYGDWRWSDFMRIARKFGYCCAYCGTKPERLDPDHVVPLSRGGSNTLSNLLPSCPKCNGDKGALTLTEWEASRARRGKPPVQTSWSSADSRYVHLTEPGLLVA